MKWLAALVLVAGLAARAEPPTRIEIVLLAAAETTLALDGLQTLSIANAESVWAYTNNTTGQRVTYRRFTELNPLLGGAPSPGLVVSYFASVMAATAATWYFVPKSRIALPLAVSALESVMVLRNGVIMGWRFGF